MGDLPLLDLLQLRHTEQKSLDSAAVCECDRDLEIGARRLATHHHTFAERGVSHLVPRGDRGYGGGLSSRTPAARGWRRRASSASSRRSGLNRG